MSAQRTFLCVSCGNEYELSDLSSDKSRLRMRKKICVYCEDSAEEERSTVRTRTLAAPIDGVYVEHMSQPFFDRLVGNW